MTTTGHVDALGDRADRRERVTESEAAGEGGLRRLLDDGAVHHGIGVGRTELEDVGAVLGEGDRRLDARGEVGEADRKVADERAASFRLGGIDGRGDAGVSSRRLLPPGRTRLEVS